MKILSFLLVQTFLIANIAQADFSRDVPDKMPVSHFQNRKFRKPIVKPDSTYSPPISVKLSPDYLPKVRTKGISHKPKDIPIENSKVEEFQIGKLIEDINNISDPIKKDLSIRDFRKKTREHSFKQKSLWKKENSLNKKEENRRKKRSIQMITLSGVAIAIVGFFINTILNDTYSDFKEATGFSMSLYDFLPKMFFPSKDNPPDIEENGYFFQTHDLKNNKELQFEFNPYENEITVFELYKGIYKNIKRFDIEDSVSMLKLKRLYGNKLSLIEKKDLPNKNEMYSILSKDPDLQYL